MYEDVAHGIQLVLLCSNMFRILKSLLLQCFHEAYTCCNMFGMV